MQKYFKHPTGFEKILFVEATSLLSIFSSLNLHRIIILTTYYKSFQRGGKLDSFGLLQLPVIISPEITLKHSPRVFIANKTVSILLISIHRISIKTISAFI